MRLKKKFEIISYDNNDFEAKSSLKYSNYINWPVIYFLRNEIAREAYVGETTDVITRLTTHAKTERKKDLKSINIIFSELFNKSATLDFESNLIRYLSADGKYSLQNGNLGISNHRYYQQKEIYTDIFKDVWQELRSLGIARHSLEYLDNSDLFKYSPYKSLSLDQVKSLKSILESLLDDKYKVNLIHGGAGTGKSILAIFLFKLIKTDLSDFNYSDFDESDIELFELLKSVKEIYGDMKMALVVPMASFRKTLSNVFKNIKGLSSKMVIGPSELVNQTYDLVIVDEGHRLRRRANLGSYFGTFDKNCESLGLDKLTASELDWVNLQSKKSIIFYDSNQSIKPSDALKKDFDALMLKETTNLQQLKTQFRVRGGDAYVNLIHQIFSCDNLPIQKINLSEYDFCIYTNLGQMVEQIQRKEQVEGLSRMVAGFAWDWVSKKDKNAYDIVIDDTHLRWNSTAIDWVNSINAINEVGCIHTTQGYDLNYTGVIIGPELDYDFENQQLIVDKTKYKDKNGRNGITNTNDLLNYILNIYKTILLRGIKGTYIFVCNENLRKYLSQYIPVYKEDTKQLQLVDTPSLTTVPLYDLSVAAGLFSDVQETEAKQFIEIPQIINPSEYFACRVVGESMNKIIPNGSICLFRKYSGGSKNGLITLVESVDFTDAEFGAHYTIKEYSSKKTNHEDGWRHEEVHLLPNSFDPNFEPIILTDDRLSELKVIGIFVRILK